MSNGRSLETADNTQEVDYTTGYRFQFEAESNRIYLAFIATENADDTSEDAGKSPAFAVRDQPILAPVDVSGLPGVVTLADTATVSPQARSAAEQPCTSVSVQPRSRDRLKS